jgi:site-specific DNA recombinase
MKAAIYIRVSTEEQARTDKASLPVQENACRAYCADKGYELVDVFRDPGASGGDMERPGLQSMLDAARDGAFGVAVSYCVDRLARDQNIVGTIDYILDGTGARLEFATEDYEQSPGGKLVRSIRAYAGEEERHKIRSRTRMGRRGRAERGLPNAPTPPYGYRRDGDTLALDEYEADHVRAMFSWYLLDGLALRRIAFRLNDEHVPMKRRGPKGWTAENVRRILNRECYTGRGWQNVKRALGKGKYALNPREEWLPLDYPIIIDRETWEAVQAKIAQNKPWRRSPAGDHHLLQGLARCAECGHILLCTNGGSKQHRQRAYSCHGQSRRGYDCRTPSWIRADRLEAPVWARIVEACQNPDLWLDASRAYDAQAGILTADVDALAADVRAKLDKAEESRKRLIRLCTDGTFRSDDKDVRTVKAEYEQSIDSWRHELERIEARASEHRAQAVDRAQAEAMAREIGPKVDRLSAEERRELVRAMVQRVWVDREGNVTIEAALPHLERASVVALQVLKSASATYHFTRVRVASRVSRLPTRSTSRPPGAERPATPPSPNWTA